MSVTQMQVLSDRTVFQILDLEPYGVPDIHRQVEILHSTEAMRQLPTVSLEELPEQEENWSFRLFSIPGLGTVVFKFDYWDQDWSSWSYRPATHKTQGPFLLVDKER